MDKVKGISIIIIAVVSVIVTVLVANILLDTTGKVNQGNFRISDVIIESSATLKEVQDKNVKIEKLSGLVFDVSQTNTVSILIESNVNASKISIENLVVTDPALKGNINICQKDYEKYDITPELNSIPIYLEQEEGKYIITLLIDNDNVITDKSVSDEFQEIKYDATIFNLFGIDVSQLQFNVSFDLVITDESGQTVKTTMYLKMPTDETLTEGMSILRQDATKFLFTVED
ncbi:MAG: hypothetical protein ACI4ON_00780 [Clostridia bacterium]